MIQIHPYVLYNDNNEQRTFMNFPDITEIEAKHGFSIEALEQLEYIITYLNECASPELLKEIKISEDGFDQLVNYTTELRVFDGINYPD